MGIEDKIIALKLQRIARRGAELNFVVADVIKILESSKKENWIRTIKSHPLVKGSASGKNTMLGIFMYLAVPASIKSIFCTSCPVYTLGRIEKK